MIPPISIDPESIKCSIIIREDSLQNIYETISKYAIQFEVLAINNVKNVMDKNESLFPDFTERQREIATYCYRHGFFESPKKISADEIAKNFGISVSAMNEHIRKIEKIVMKYFFE